MMHRSSHLCVSRRRALVGIVVVAAIKLRPNISSAFEPAPIKKAEPKELSEFPIEGLYYIEGLLHSPQGFWFLRRVEPRLKKDPVLPKLICGRYPFNFHQNVVRMAHNVRPSRTEGFRRLEFTEDQFLTADFGQDPPRVVDSNRPPNASRWNFYSEKRPFDGANGFLEHVGADGKRLWLSELAEEQYFQRDPSSVIVLRRAVLTSDKRIRIELRRVDLGDGK